MRRRRGNRRLTLALIAGEGIALGVVLVFLGTYIWMSLSGCYEVLLRTNTYGEHYAELALLCVAAVLVTVDVVRRLARLRREVVREHGK